MDALAMVDVQELASYWGEAPPLADCVRAYLGIGAQQASRFVDTPLGPELTPEQYDSLIAGMKSNAAQHGLRKPHG